MCCRVASFSQSEGESECDVTFESDLQGSNNNEAQSDGFISNEQYLPKNNSEACSGRKNYRDLNDKAETLPLPPLHSFTFMADPFVGHCYNTVPAPDWGYFLCSFCL